MLVAYDMPWRASQETRLFLSLATYSHVGRADPELPWERLNKIDALT